MANETRLILPSSNELILTEVRLIIEQKRLQNEANEKAERQHKIKASKNTERKTIKRYIAFATIQESNRLGIEHILNDFSSPNLLSLQKRALARLCQDSERSFAYMVAMKLMQIVKKIVRRPWYVLLTIPIFTASLMVTALGSIAVYLPLHYVLSIPSPDQWMNDAYMFNLSFIVILSWLTFFIYNNVKEKKRIEQKIKRFLRIYPQSCLSVSELKKEIHNIQNSANPHLLTPYA